MKHQFNHNLLLNAETTEPLEIETLEILADLETLESLVKLESQENLENLAKLENQEMKTLAIIKNHAKLENQGTLETAKEEMTEIVVHALTIVAILVMAAEMEEETAEEIVAMAVEIETEEAASRTAVHVKTVHSQMTLNTAHQLLTTQITTHNLLLK